MYYRRSFRSNFLDGCHQGAETSCVCVCTKRVCDKVTVTKGVYCRYTQYIRISAFVLNTV